MIEEESERDAFIRYCQSQHNIYGSELTEALEEYDQDKENCSLFSDYRICELL